MATRAAVRASARRGSVVLDVAVVGAGLAGVSLAARLREQGREVVLFEARDRTGGRILSQPPAAAVPGAGFNFDLGPSWIWPEAQPLLAELVQRFGLRLHEQWQQGTSVYMAEREAPPAGYVDDTAYAGTYRIEGGVIQLLTVLRESLPDNMLHLNHRLVAVIDQGKHVELEFAAGQRQLHLTARQVVITIPPRLLVNSVRFAPALDVRLSAAMRETPTWMAGHAKAVVRYDRPFWRDAGLSGNGFAIYPGAALREIFDASSPQGEIGALSGFLGLSAPMRDRYRNDLEALLLEQLVRMFGPAAATPEEVLVKDWCDDALTATVEDQVPLTAHPQYGHRSLQLDHWNDKLYFGGTETAQQFGGYLEGALESAARIARSLAT